MKQQKKKILSVKVTEKEFKRIENAAQKAGYKSNSAYVRECLETRAKRTLREKDRQRLVTLICTVQSQINQDGIEDAVLEQAIEALKEELKKWR